MSTFFSISMIAMLTMDSIANESIELVFNQVPSFLYNSMLMELIFEIIYHDPRNNVPFTQVKSLI